MAMDNDVQRLIAAANKTGITAQCPSCGQSAWENWIPFGAVAGIPLDTTDPLNLHRALAIACSKCGFIRLHSTQILDQHMDPREDH